MGHISAERKIRAAAPVAELRADERMAQLALAFEMDLAIASDSEPKWPIGYTIVLALACGFVLWVAIAAAAHLIWSMS